MMTPASSAHIWIAAGHTDMRRGMHGLSALGTDFGVAVGDLVQGQNCSGGSGGCEMAMRRGVLANG